MLTFLLVTFRHKYVLFFLLFTSDLYLLLFNSHRIFIFLPEIPLCIAFFSDSLAKWIFSFCCSSLSTKDIRWFWIHLYLQTHFPRFPIHSVVSGDCFGITAEGFCPPDVIFSMAFPLFFCQTFVVSTQGGWSQEGWSQTLWETERTQLQGPLSRLEESPSLSPLPLDEVRIPGLRRRILRTQGPVKPGPELCRLGVST